MEQISLAEVLEQVHNKREQGYNCAEGVFWGVTRGLGLEPPVSCVSGFGGGIAGSGSVCGALCGAIAALGVYVGRTEPAQNKEKAKCTALSKAVAARFEEALGTRLCKEILGYLPGQRPEDRILVRGTDPKCIEAVQVATIFALEEIEADSAEERAKVSANR